MIKKTLYFENQAYISLWNQQLKVQGKNLLNEEYSRTIPVEDIGLVILDHAQITLTHGIINALIQNNACIIHCDEKHLPNGLMLPLADNDTFTEKVRIQIEASEPLKKQLWRQTVATKIFNQSRTLQILGLPYKEVERLYKQVSSGDQENLEGHAAALYWSALLKPYAVNRGRYEEGPNFLFNYGYAVLRAVIARNLVGSGCLPVIGIHHRNKYNAYCLADDIMEPFRPIVDLYIMQKLLSGDMAVGENLTKENKIALLNIPVIDITIDKKKSPLMVGAQRTTSSLVKCFSGELRKIQYPEIQC